MPALTSNSGYVPCACRDCFDLAIGSAKDPKGFPTLCIECDESGCSDDSKEDCKRCDEGTCSHDSCTNLTEG